MYLLTNEQPLFVIPSLAMYFNEKGATILLLLHKNLQEEGQSFENHYWYCQSYEDWRTQLPFLRKSAIKYQLKKLESLGIVHATDRFNKFPVDRTKWYRIDYAMLEAMTGFSSEILDGYLT